LQVLLLKIQSEVIWSVCCCMRLSDRWQRFFFFFTFCPLNTNVLILYFWPARPCEQQCPLQNKHLLQIKCKHFLVNLHGALRETTVCHSKLFCIYRKVSNIFISFFFFYHLCFTTHQHPLVPGSVSACQAACLFLQGAVPVGLLHFEQNQRPATLDASFGGWLSVARIRIFLHYHPKIQMYPFLLFYWHIFSKIIHPNCSSASQHKLHSQRNQIFLFLRVKKGLYFELKLL